MENNNIEITNFEDLKGQELVDFLTSLELPSDLLRAFKIFKNTGVTISDYTYSVDNAYDLLVVLKEALYHIDSLEFTLGEQEEEVAELRKDLSDLEDHVDELEDDLWDTQREVSDLEDEIEELKDEVSELEDKVSSLEDEVSNLEDEVNTLEDKLSEY